MKHKISRKKTNSAYGKQKKLWQYIHIHCSYNIREIIKDFAKEKYIYVKYNPTFSTISLEVPPQLLEETKQFVFSLISGNPVYIE